MRVLLILRQRSGVKCPERFGAFVNGVCDNVVRELGREDRHEEPWDDKVEEPVDLTVDPDAGLISAEMKRVIRQVLAALPEKDRRILKPCTWKKSRRLRSAACSTCSQPTCVCCCTGRKCWPAKPT